MKITICHLALYKVIASMLCSVVVLLLGIQSNAQCPSGLLTNSNGYYGGFEAGGVNGSNNFGTGIALTEYSYGPLPREYQILMNTNGQSGYLPLLPHSGNYFFTAHTSPSVPDWKIWYKTISVIPGEKYEFCAWVANLKENPVGGFAVAINVNDGTTTTLVATQFAVTNSWVQLCGTYTVPSGVTSIEVEIEDPDPSSFGGSHFLAIDDICFRLNVPDLSPNIIVSPSIMHGTTQFNVIVEIFEILNIPTDGSEILVRIPKDPRISFSYNAAATTIGSTAVDNNVWTYDGTNPIFHIFKTNTIIPGFGVSTFGFRATFAPGQTQGKFTLTASLNSGSGGEVRTDNNQDAEVIDYFIN